MTKTKLGCDLPGKKTYLWHASCSIPPRSEQFPSKWTILISGTGKRPEARQKQSQDTWITCCTNWDMLQPHSFRWSPCIPPSYRHSHRILISSLVWSVCLSNLFCSISFYNLSIVQSTRHSGLRFQPLQWQGQQVYNWIWIIIARVKVWKLPEVSSWALTSHQYSVERQEFMSHFEKSIESISIKSIYSTHLISISPTNQPTNQPINQSTRQSVNQTINRSINPIIYQSMHQSIYASINLLPSHYN